jgi:hypothetical protein
MRQQGVNAEQYNAQIDKALAESGVVDSELFTKLRDAYSYDAASTVAWVEAKLHVLQRRVSNEQPLSLFTPKLDTQMVLASVSEFSAWVQCHFPGVRV